MFRNVLWCVLVLFLAACSSMTETQGEKTAAPGGPAEARGQETIAGGGDVRIGEPVTHRNLTVFGLYLASSEGVEEDYITLKEALKSKKVEVKEKGSGGTVNCVVISNGSSQSMYILAGQVIIGGKQDRVTTRDTIVPPGEKIEVEVCCVEAGRWRPRASAGAKATGFSEVAGTRGQASMNVTYQLKGSGGQSVVWEEVAKAADKLKAQTSTGTYKEVVEKTKVTVDEYLAALNAVFGKDRKICGFVSCVNGKVEACDLFASPSLLAKFMESVLRSYALDALYAGEAKDAKKATAGSVKSFVDEMFAAEKDTKTLAQNKHRRVEKAETKRIIGFRNAARSLEGCYKSLHRNYYRKSEEPEKK